MCKIIIFHNTVLELSRMQEERVKSVQSLVHMDKPAEYHLELFHYEGCHYVVVHVLIVKI